MTPNFSSKRARATAIGTGVTSWVVAAVVMGPMISRTAAGQGIGVRSNLASVTLTATKPEGATGETVVREARDRLGRDAGGVERVSVTLGPDVRGEAVYVRDARGRMQVLGREQPVTVCESAAACEQATVVFRRLRLEPGGRGEGLLRVVYHLQFVDSVRDLFLLHELQLTTTSVRVSGVQPPDPGEHRNVERR